MLLRALPVFSTIIGGCSAQLSTSAAGDKAVLLAMRDAADMSACNDDMWSAFITATGACPLESWDAATEPCARLAPSGNSGSLGNGEGWDDYFSGWLGVVCDAVGGRVTYLGLRSTGVGGELLPFVGRLPKIKSFWSSNNPALGGDVASLCANGPLELRKLDLRETAARGEIASLAACTHLGEDGYELFPGDPGVPRTGDLYLVGSRVHGPVAAVRALPHLHDWSPLSGFTACSAFGGCAAAGLPMVDGAADIAGTDSCACCGAEAPRGADPTSGECVDAGSGADLNGDGRVNIDDLLRLLAAFGSSADGDTDGDGQTNVVDLLALLADFGQ